MLAIDEVRDRNVRRLGRRHHHAAFPGPSACWLVDAESKQDPATCLTSASLRLAEGIEQECAWYGEAIAGL